MCKLGQWEYLFTAIPPNHPIPKPIMANYRLPKFLTDNDYPIHRVRCPIHGFIRFSENEKVLINHPIFQRLRFIKQLALNYYVYPGATNTRFEHSLGVMEIATRSFDTILSNKGALLENVFKQVEGFEKKPLILTRQILRLAALLHDIGHAPFCHAAEKLYFRGDKHEDLTMHLLTKNELGVLIDKIYWSGCSNYVALLVEGAELPPQFKLLHDLVSGEMDADRTDYLLRDSLHCGVEYGHFDYLRMIECIDIYENEDKGLELALQRGGFHTFEALIIARYQMTTQVYSHRVRRIYDRYLNEYHKAIGDQCPNKYDEIIAENDITMMNRIFKDAREAEGDIKKWASRIVDRNHHKLVFEKGYNADNKILKSSKNLFALYKKEYPDVEFIIDNFESTIHKQYIEGEISSFSAADSIIELQVVDSRGRNPIPISRTSQIISKIDKKLRCVRIYADVVEKNLRDELGAFGHANFK